MPERHDNTIRKLFLKNKTVKVTPSSTTRIRLIVCMEDPKKTPGVDHVYIEEDTEVEEITIADTITTSHSVGSNIIFIMDLDASQASIEWKKDNKYTLSIDNMPNM
jgi:hypothetical protein